MSSLFGKNILGLTLCASLLAGVVVACSDDDSGSTPTPPGSDAGTDSGQGPLPEAGVDSGDAGLVEVDPELKRTVDTILRDEVAAKPVPGATLAIKNPGGQIYVTAAGQRGPHDTAAMAGDDRFIMGSATKMITAQVILKLVDAKKLTLDEPIRRWFPDLPRAEAVTVRHLLRHQSGYNEYLQSPAVKADYRKVRSPKELTDLALALGFLNDAPGGNVAYYSNTNYVLLAQIIEKEDGRTWAQAIREHIAKPLGTESLHAMTDEGIADKVVGGLYDGSAQNKYAWDASLGYGAGALTSNAVDLMIVLDAVYHGALLTEAVRPELRKAVEFEIAGFPGTYGAGLMCVKMPAEMGGLEICGHQGGLTGYSSSPFWDPATGTMAVVLANASEGDDVSTVGVAINAIIAAEKYIKK